MYNLRYHIASLVAVFLALSLGLLLGGITVQSGVLTKQRAALVQSLRTDYTKLSSQNQKLQSTLKLEQHLAGWFVDKAIDTRLDGKNVLVLTNAGQVEGLNATEASIRAAGGTPVIVTLNNPSLGLEKTEVASAVATALGTSSSSGLIDTAAQAVVAEWMAGAAGPVTNALAEANVFEAPTMPASGFDGVVDLATFDGKADPGAIALGVEFDRAGVTAVGAQTVGSETNLAAQADRAGLSALDTLGTDAGRYTTVMLLTGAKPGYYGTGSAAVAEFPTEMAK